MLSERLLTSTAIHKRETKLIASTAFPFTITPSTAGANLGYTYPHATYLLFRTSGQEADATVTVDGLLDGSPQSEAVTLSTLVPVTRSVNAWSQITQLSSTDTTPGQLTVEGLYGDGQPAVVPTTINSSLKGYFTVVRRPVLATDGAGLVLAEQAMFYTNIQSSPVEAGDLLTIDSTDYKVEGVKLLRAPGGDHHIELALKRLR